MIELQFLNWLLSTKDFSIIRLNALDRTYFPNYIKEFDFICQHYEEYGTVCDKETFINAFPDFKFIQVNESSNYLLDKIQEENTYNKALPIVQKVAGILTNGDSRNAVQYAIDELSRLDTAKAVPVTDLIADAHLRYEKYLDKCNGGTKNSYISTGFVELDKIMGGWDCEEEFGVIGGRTNQGKSWWLYFFLLEAVKQGKVVGLYSGEMSEDKVGYRIDTFLSHISNFKISKGHSEVKEEYTAHINKIKDIKGKLLIITPKILGGPATVPKLRAFIEKYGIELLGIDQYSLMDDARGARIRHEKYEDISMDLKIMQTQVKIPILVAAQLSRSAAVAQRNGESAGTDMFAGSDRISQDATTMLTITQKDDCVVCEIVKGRECKVGDKLCYNWDIDTGRFIYIPTENDPDAMNPKETCKELKEQFNRRSSGDVIF